ncbi:polar-differentiation response regulator DivK [bacterium BMS3Abin07]|nr:polar-differentiation response regulator DivK [bacterium BMS3Abin07]GBE31950.1 polar-differentiation response regulator DivK [bacterium BMS3Bbin05]HDL21074.1 response regulator [Nitrospirota bacterium]HDO22270.1 response regulator [Nitrospirota bacterium]
MKVLVIEDNELNLRLASDILKTRGYDVFEARDADTGIAIARKELPHLVLMDVQLPGMDGLAATKVLKGDEKTRHIKIIAFTAFAMKGDRDQILEAGCDGYISKPFKLDEFIETIESAGVPAKKTGSSERESS